MRIRQLVMAAGLCAFALTGCYESPDATVYEPGDYKGASDPLVKKLRSGEVQQVLVDRFQMGQTDR